MYEKVTADKIPLVEGMTIFYRWPSEHDIWSYKYTEKHEEWNLEYKNRLNKKCRIVGYEKYMYSSKKAMLESNPEMKNQI